MIIISNHEVMYIQISIFMYLLYLFKYLLLYRQPNIVQNESVYNYLHSICF